MVGPVNEEGIRQSWFPVPSVFCFPRDLTLNVVKTCEKVTFTDEGKSVMNRTDSEVM